MNYSSQGAAAIAEANPFSRTAAGNSSWRDAAPMEIGGTLGAWQPPTYPLVGAMGEWREPSYPLVGFDTPSFLSNNKLVLALGAAVVAGLVAYKYGYR